VAALAVSAASGTTGGGGGGGGGSTLPAKTSMPMGATWEGNWSSTFGPLTVINLQGKDGWDFGGVYQYQSSGTTVEGVFAGKVDGNWFGLVWSEQRGNGQAKGLAVWAMNPDGRSFQGTWGAGDSATNGGSWVGQR
jgi:hypothetical protein